MKTFLTTLFLASTALGYSQNYQPFSETSSKRFFATTDPTDNNFYFHADSSQVAGNAITFHQYYAIENTGIQGNDPANCSFWGGTTGEELDTTWLGIDLIWDQASQELQLTNKLNETITFNFGLALNNSQAFYTNNTSIYSIEYTALNSETFLNTTDNVKTFTVSVTDLGGTPVSSALNNFEIKLSENYGLLSFIDTYNLPSTELGLELQGQTNPLLGTYQLTYDECYPWTVNDVVQHYYYESMGFGAPPLTRKYSTLTVTDRIETVDSVRLLFSTDQVSFYQTSTGTTTQSSSFTNQIAFKKATPVSELPWNKPHGNSMETRATETTQDHCGTYANFQTNEGFITYCDSCQCFGYADGFGQTIQEKRYVEQYGLYKTSYVGYGPLQNVPNGGTTLIYSNIGGIECGTLWNDLPQIETFRLEVYPNPSKGLVTINSEFPINSITVFDCFGREMIHVLNVDQNETTFSLENLQNGAYIIEVEANDSVQKKTIFKQ